MKLFTKEIETKLQKQFNCGSSLENQDVICKIFNPYGLGYWYIMNQDPDDPDYLWCIAKIHETETGSVLKSELENIRINVAGYKLPLERDRGFRQRKAVDVWNDLLNGEHV